MRLVPSSLGGRLVLGAAVFTVGALAVATLVIGVILDRFIVGQLDQRLDGTIAAIADGLETDATGVVRLGTTLDGPPFDRVGSGWYWQVSGAGIDLRSRSLADGSIDVPPPPFEWRRLLDARGAPAEAGDEAGGALHLRVRAVMAATVPVTITASAPASAVAGPLRQALFPLVATLALLGVVLVLASLLQVRLGLRPLTALRHALQAVRAGRLQRVPADQPREVQPLVAELNALLDQNESGLAAARRHVANLAHGLKTPLATLAVALGDDNDPGGAMRTLVGRIERGIRHHLTRARADALGRPGRARTMLAPRVVDLVAALRRIHQDRDIACTVAVDPALAVACEAQDLDEMLGNLLDNAFKWARRTVAVAATARDGQVAVTIDDDGAGLADDRLPEALLPGRRLDEAVEGHGFGLSITLDLAELHGGGLTLERSPRGGLRATLTLAAAPE